MSDILRVGDVVTHRGHRSIVTAIELVAEGESDGGIPLEQAPWSAAGMLVVDLNTGRWAWGDQLEACPACAESR
jgi:hypothetical protein